MACLKYISSVALAFFISKAESAGYRTVGSSGCAAQMVFLPPYTDTAVFLDNYHANYGGPGVDLQTGAHSKEPYMQDDGSGLYVFGVEYSWRTNGLRKLTPKSNTFCAAGSFLPDGTMVNVAGAETYSGNVDVSKMQDGRQSLRRYASGPCNGACTIDFESQQNALQSRRWYPTSQTMINGDILVVGGSMVGLLVTNEASINNPTYEIVRDDGSAAPKQSELEILELVEQDNQNANFSFNLYPILSLLPNAENSDHIFTMVGNRASVYDYAKNQEVKDLPDIPGGPRCFPGSATAMTLPLEAPSFTPRILVCGGSSGDIPDPQTLGDCWHINPTNANPTWVKDDDLPNGGQVMTDGILLPDGTALLLNGAHKGSAGGYMADDPVTQPLIYDPTKQSGSRFTKAPGTTNVPRLYHSVAILLPSAEILVAGSNPDVFYNPYGNVSINAGYPEFNNNGHQSYLHQQQARGVNYHTEYRVEIYSPSYMDSQDRPSIQSSPDTINFGKGFQISTSNANGKQTAIRLSYSGFHTHGIDMGQRLVTLDANASGDSVQVTAPPNSTVIPPGVYLLWVIADGVPSEGKWVKLQ